MVNINTIGFTGRCLCGGIQFQGKVGANAALAVHCHCKDCQRATGSGFATVLAVAENDLQVTGELSSHKVIGDSGGAVSREFCPTCGSPLFTRAELSPGLRFIKAGVLDDSSWLQPAMACWTDSREEWCVLTHDLPSVKQNPVITSS